MAKTKRIDRAACRAIVDLAVEAAREVLEREGLTVEQDGGARFDDTQVTFKIKAMVAGRVDESQERESLLLGFSENIVGKTFQLRRTIHTISGISLRRHKYPISTTTQNGARYKFTVAQVKRELGI